MIRFEIKPLTTQSIAINDIYLFFDENTVYELLSDYITLTECLYILSSLLITRFIFTWRIWLFIYITFILAQALFIYYVLRKITPIEFHINEYTSITLNLLCNLVVPFGNLLRAHISQGTFILNGGGGGLVIPQSKPTSFETFTESFLNRNKHTQISQTLYKDYITAFTDFNFSTCLKLAERATLNESKLLYKLSNIYLYEQRDNPYFERLSKGSFTKDYQEFMEIFNTQLLEKCELIYNVKFKFPKEKYMDLASLDSAQREISSFNNIFTKARQEFKKLEELMDCAAVKSLYGEKYFIYNVAEKATKTDYYVRSVNEDDIIYFSLDEDQARYKFEDIKIVESTYKLPHKISGIDIYRKDSQIQTDEAVIQAIRTEKVIPLIKMWKQQPGLMPQTHHELSIVLHPNNRAAQNGINTLENMQDIKTLSENTGIHFTIQSVIDPFLQ